MRYKLIATDFDGTLNRDDNTVSEHTKQMIARYIAEGGHFVISTGRSAESCERAYQISGIDLDVPAISHQGALIRTSKTRRVIREVFVPQQAVAMAVSAFAKDYVQVYQGEMAFRNREFSGFAEMYYRVTGVKTEYRKDLEKVDKGILKIIVSEFGECFEGRLQEFRRRFKGVLDMDFTRGEMLEIYSAEAGKGNAVRYLAETVLGLSADEVIAIGDSRNDISMIEYAGLGVAMENSDVQEVKLAADLVTDSNLNEGVARVIGLALQS